MSTVKAKLQFLLDGKLHPLHGDTIYISTVSYLLDWCPYKHALQRLQAGIDSEQGTISTPKAWGQSAKQKHEELQKLLGLTRRIDCEVEVRHTESDTGIKFRGFLDHLISPVVFEEWHFPPTSGPRLQPHHLLTAKIYAYCLFHYIPITYIVKLWGNSTPIQNPPDITKVGTFSEKDIPSIEGILNKIIAIFTGKTEIERNGKGADFCPYRFGICKSKCPAGY